tara:strand:+ start:401 stop:649 length:249 start_codon:yes stop_codon:yes gene_type:complete
MTAEELSEARLSQLMELERENTEIRVKMVTLRREYNFVIGALRVLVDIGYAISDSETKEERVRAITDMKDSLEAVGRLLDDY